MVGVASKEISINIKWISNFVKNDQLIPSLKMGYIQQDNFISFLMRGKQTTNKVSDHFDAS